MTYALLQLFHTDITCVHMIGLQGGPHVHQIAGVATQLKEVMTPEFKEYARQVRANACALGEKLSSLGYTIATGGTDNHLVLWDLKPQSLNGAKLQTVCDNCSITLNKNAVLGDRSALTPGGVRIGILFLYVFLRCNVPIMGFVSTELCITFYMSFLYNFLTRFCCFRCVLYVYSVLLL